MDRHVTRWQVAFAVTGVGLFALMVGHDVPALSSAFIVGFLGWILWDQFRRVRTEWPAVRAALLERGSALLDSLRPFYQVTPSVALVEAVCMLLAVAAILLSLAFGLKESSPYLQHLFVSIFFIVGSLECVHRGIHLMRHAWLRTAGKLLLGAIGAIVYLIANAAARHVLVEINQADPKYFPSFVGLVALGFTPLFFVYGLSLVAALWSIVEIICFLFLFAAFEALRFLRAYAGDIRQALSHTRHQAHSGESFSTRGDKDRSIKDLLTNFGRSMLFIGFTVAVVAAGNQVLQARHDLVMRGLRVAVVMLEYNELPVCGTPPIAFQVPLETGHYSIARPSDHGVSFSTVACPTRGGKE